MDLPVELSRKQTLIAAAGVAGLAFATYFNALANGLVWDDPIVLGRQLRVFSSIAAVFFPPHDIPQFSPDYYRPLTTLSYLIDQGLGGSGPFPFHLSVVLYHAAATVLVLLFGQLVLRGLPGAPLAAIAGAALFAVHPIHSESVAWGAGRSDVIACVFGLAGATVYCSDPQRRMSRAALAAALMFLGALAKETTLSLLLLVPGLDVVMRHAPRGLATPASRSERRRRAIASAPHTFLAVLRFAPFAAVLLVYLLLRSSALTSMVGTAAPVTQTTMVNVLGALAFYMFKVVAPIEQCAYVSDLPTRPWQLIACLVALATVAVAFWFTFRKQRPVAFLLMWTVVTLAPSLAIVLKIPNAPVAERYLYIPSVGVCLLFGIALAAAFASAPSVALRGAAVACTIALVSVGFVATIRRNAVWRSNLSLWTDTAEKNTTDGLPLRSLAAARLESGDVDGAEELFTVALKRRNNSVGQQTIYNNLGSIAMQRKRYDAAEVDYRRAVDLNRTADGLYNLGLVPLTRAIESTPEHSDDWRRNEARQARDLLLQAAILNPHDPDTQVAIGQAAQAAGDSAGARIHYEQALSMGVPTGTAEAVRKLLNGLASDS